MTRILAAARWLAVAVVVAFAIRALTANWDEFWRTVGGLAWTSSALSLIALVASIAISAYGWQVVVDGLGDSIGYFRGARICLVGQLGKYVPGSVWAYLLQMELGRKAGLGRARIFTASLLQFGIGLVAAMPLAALAGRDEWLLLTLPIAVLLHPSVLGRGVGLVLRILRKPPLAQPLDAGTIAKAFAFAVAAWFLQGVHLWLLTGSVGLLTSVGAMALAMTAGTFAFLLPSGAGVREAVLVAVLTASGISPGQALAFALASRVMFTLADLITTALVQPLGHFAH
jgi:glycosyltransferase 2 family protein